MSMRLLQPNPSVVVALTAAAFVAAPALSFAWTTSANAEMLQPIQAPINGDEDLGDLSQPQQALPQF